MPRRLRHLHIYRHLFAGGPTTEDDDATGAAGGGAAGGGAAGGGAAGGSAGRTTIDPAIVAKWKTKSWDVQYDAVRRYKNVAGSLPSFGPLHAWWEKQRTATLNWDQKQRMKRLLKHSGRTLWQRQFEKLAKLVTKHKQLPSKQTNHAVYRWMFRQFNLYMKHELSQTRVNRLQQAGILVYFDEIIVKRRQKTQLRREKATQLKQYVRQHGRLPKYNDCTPQFYDWLNRRIHLFDRQTLSQEERDDLGPNILQLFAQQLEKMQNTQHKKKKRKKGGKNQSQAANWQKGLDDLKQFVDQHQRLPKSTDPQSTTDGWLRRQVTAINNRTILADRLVLLTQAGIMDLINERRRGQGQRTEQLKAFVDKHGRLPKASETDERLRAWMIRYISYFKNKQLLPEKYKELEQA
ncbi:hypothetical protein OAM67_01240, partial [bacterium]|nr:hypothetical protein [bacterium]